MNYRLIPMINYRQNYLISAFCSPNKIIQQLLRSFRNCKSVFVMLFSLGFDLSNLALANCCPERSKLFCLNPFLCQNTKSFATEELCNPFESLKSNSSDQQKILPTSSQKPSILRALICFSFRTSINTSFFETASL